MENKKLGALLVCGLVGISLLAGCSKQEDLNQNGDRPDFGGANEENIIHGSGGSRQGPRDGMGPRRGMGSGRIFSGEHRSEMMGNPVGTGKIKEASLPVNGKLAVLNTCIGCGKCARIASSHFEMKGGISVVKSQENINSQSVNHAIQNCPVDAIVIQA